LLKIVKHLGCDSDELDVTDQHGARRPRPRSGAGSGRISFASGFLATLIGAAALVAPIASHSAHAVADDDWLGVVNTYRAMSGLAPITGNNEWSAQDYDHSCYMLLNGMSHDETPGLPGYTPGGDLAGNKGNVAVSSSVSATARSHIELWMTGPFHTIGILRPNLTSSGFGMCANPDATLRWHSGATLDVIRGLDSSVTRPSTPIVFPGNGATVRMSTFIAETPSPVAMCGWSGAAGLPLIAMMPSDVTAANSTLTGPNGPIATCTLQKGNVSDGTARAILDGDNAVIVMPRDPLADGAYTATVNSNGGSITWSFNVNRNAALSAQPTTPPPPPVDATPATDAANYEPVTPFRFVDSRIGLRSVRLTRGAVTPIQITNDPNILAVSANFVSTDSGGPGYLTTYNCTSNRPEVSTLGYRPGTVVANQAFVPLTDGRMCIYSLMDTDVVIDINGYYRRGNGAGFTPITPVRLYDTRDTGARLQPGEVRTLTVSGVSPGAPGDATAVALNLTAITPELPGFIRVFPCGSPAGNEISSINFGQWEVRANTVVVPVADGTVCLQANVAVDIAVDLSGFFGSSKGYRFQPLSPVRMFDSRLATSELNEVTGGAPLAAGQTVRLHIAGRQGVPASAKAASVNITSVDVGRSSYITAFPCGDRPLASNLNITPDQQVTANGAMVKLSAEGDLCLYTLSAVHLVVDINGVWL
jgi:Cysteine-rich secretory protein family